MLKYLYLHVTQITKGAIETASVQYAPDPALCFYVVTSWKAVLDKLAGIVQEGGGQARFLTESQGNEICSKEVQMPFATCFSGKKGAFVNSTTVFSTRGSQDTFDYFESLARNAMRTSNIDISKELSKFGCQVNNQDFISDYAALIFVLGMFSLSCCVLSYLIYKIGQRYPRPNAAHRTFEEGGDSGYGALSSRQDDGSANNNMLNR